MVGIEWSTAIGVTRRSPTGCSTSRASVRYDITGASALGICVKSGQTSPLNTPVRSASTTGSTLVTVSERCGSKSANVSVRNASPAT